MAHSIESTNGVLRFVTAGSVDDGKSTLIGRLLYDSQAILKDQINALKKASEKRGHEDLDLALITDGLMDEREQGITIDVAYRYFSTPRRKFIIADVPGHEQYTRNMATGASSADLGVIVVDVRNGMTSQARRHLYLLSLFNVRNIIVAVNKMDLLGYSRGAFEKVRDQITAFCEQFKLINIDILPISAKQGDNVVTRSENMAWHTERPLLEILESVPLTGRHDQDNFRLPVQKVCRPQTSDFPDFRGYMGQIQSGTVEEGDEVTVFPSGHRTEIKNVLAFDRRLESACAPQSVTLTFKDEIDISRGSLIAHTKDSPKVTNELDAFLFWMASEEALGKTYLMKHGTRVIRTKVKDLHFKLDIENLREEKTDRLEINEIGSVTLRLQEVIACDPYVENRSTGAFILIDEVTNDTIAGGVIC